MLQQGHEHLLGDVLRDLLVDERPHRQPVNEAGVAVGTAPANAPPAMRAIEAFTIGTSIRNRSSCRRVGLVMSVIDVA
jgi:hypothetical protein